MLVLIILVILAAIVAFFMLRAGENLRFETSADPNRVVMAAVGIVGAKRRWQTVAQSEHGASFQYRKGPKALVALLLLLCLLIPGIVYLVLAGKRESLTLSTGSSAGNATVVQVTSNGFRGKAAGRELRRGLSVRAGASSARAVPTIKPRSS
jgi:hypothetical protein